MKLDELAAQQPKGLEAQKPEPGDHDCAAVAKRKDLIEKMKTLDELDRLAAEKVMGWVWYPDKVNYQGGSWLVTRKNYETLYRESWQPTRNIAQAWECLEKDGIWKWNINYDCGNYTVTIADVSVTAHSAPEAIVKACLKAKGVEID